MANYQEMIFDQIFQFTREHEGYYVRDPQNPYCSKKFGINLAFLRAFARKEGIFLAACGLPDNPGEIDGKTIIELTDEQAKLILKRAFWDEPRFYELSRPCAAFVFDTAVCIGNNKALRMLQAAAGVKVSGSLDPKTVLACSDYSAKLIMDCCENRRRYFLPGGRAYQNKFLQDWLKRSNDQEAWLLHTYFGYDL